jgi:hypothetical protein
MKRMLLFIGAIALTVTTTIGNPLNDQQSGADVESTFVKGDKVFSVGLGLGSTLYTGRWYKTNIPPISLGVEVGVMDDFIVEDLTLGAGGYLGYSSSRYRDSFGGTTWGWDYSYIIVGGRAAVHYPLVEKLDTYTGLMLGFNITTSKSYGTYIGNSSANTGGIVYSWFAGGRYYLTDSFAVMGELGYGISYLTLGVALKF